MEDAHLMKVNALENISLFAVFDGHGGSGISNFLADNFLNVLTS
jgi:serine/threonine protein phosphatase PrpC